MLYGVSPLPSFQKLLQPVLTWKARVALIRKISKGQSISYGKTYIAPRDLRVAIIPVGYADGYPWQLSHQGASLLINGCRCPLLGRVTMDQVVVDISEAGEVAVGSEVVLLGEQRGEQISVSQLASKAGTIPWHLFTGITTRVHRLYR
jgi:alanine racemase